MTFIRQIPRCIETGQSFIQFLNLNKRSRARDIWSLKMIGQTKDYALQVSVKTFLNGLTQGLNLSSVVGKPNKLWIFAKDFLSVYFIKMLILLSFIKYLCWKFRFRVCPDPVDSTLSHVETVFTFSLEQNPRNTDWIVLYVIMRQALNQMWHGQSWCVHKLFPFISKETGRKNLH